MNNFQKNYTNAKNQLEKINLEAHNIEFEYIVKNDIQNEDGSKITYLWQVDDDKIFDKAYIDIGDRLDALKIYEYENALKAAEDDLIKYGLSIIPVINNKEKTFLNNACFGLNGVNKQYKVRQDVINLVIKLDTKTVKI